MCFKSYSLQVNKAHIDDVDTICEATDKLNPLQVQKILTMYTPGDFEERVPAALIRAVVERGADRADPSKLMLDTSFIHPVAFPFEASSPRFPLVQVPSFIPEGLLTKI